MPTQAENLELVACLGRGDSSPVDEIIPLVYNELRRLAASFLRRERRDHTLQPTALAHEVYLRLLGASDLDVPGRAEFLGLAAAQIRRILVDHARRHGATKRGGGRKRVPLDEETWAENGHANGHADLLALDDALSDLAVRCPRQGRIVELRFFGGLDLDEIASLLGVSRSTVKNEWRVARAWLGRYLAD